MRGTSLLAVLLSTVDALRVSPLPARAPPRCSPVMSAPPHVAVVGAGWGGWAASQALIENGCRVTLIDSLPDPTGATPYLTPTGKPFEAGTRGFWKDYPNIEALVRSLGMREEDVFTPFTNSSFYSPDGLEATAPVFSSAKLPFSDMPLPELPSPPPERHFEAAVEHSTRPGRRQRNMGRAQVMRARSHG